MASGVSLNKLRGRIILGEPNIISNWKGRLVVRAMTKNITQCSSARQRFLREKLAYLSPRWRIVLTDEDRDLWEQYASQLGNAITADKQDISGGMLNVIRERKSLMSGYNAYLSSNLMGYDIGMTAPRDIAPLGDPTPTPPTEVSLSYAGGTATVSWKDPALVGTPTDKCVRIWAMVQCRNRVHPQRKAYVAFGTLQYTFTDLFGTCGSTITLASLVNGLLYIQMDTIVSYDATRGMLGSAPSVVGVAKLLP